MTTLQPPPDPYREGRSPIERWFNAFFYFIDRPVTLFREKIVTPNQKYYPWYHQKFRRVPTIDTCAVDDHPCYLEADAQFRRDQMVDSEVLSILRNRAEHCVLYEGHDSKARCAHMWETYEENAANWFAKYGDLGVLMNVRSAYMKQKHRLVWERRHGKVGTGMKNTED